MNAVNDTLRTKAEVESLLPVMWSLYHAARSDVVGQCRQSIEAPLPLFYAKAATSDMIRLGLELVRTTTECLHLQKSQILVVDQILCDITISETFGKDTSVFYIGRLSHRDGLACGLLWEIFCFIHSYRVCNGVHPSNGSITAILYTASRLPTINMGRPFF